MSLTTSPIQQDIFTVVAAFLATITGLVVGTTIVQGIGNRVAIPLAAPGFIEMTIVRRRRLNTNIETWDQTIDDPTEVTVEAHWEVVMQIDCYAPNSFDWCNMIETLWRSPYGVKNLAPTCAPLYTNDSHMAPLDDSEDQYEQRWIIEAVLQYNPVTATPMEFANSLELDVVNVDERYPP